MQNLWLPTSVYNRLKPHGNGYSQGDYVVIAITAPNYLQIQSQPTPIIVGPSTTSNEPWPANVLIAMVGNHSFWTTPHVTSGLITGALANWSRLDTRAFPHNSFHTISLHTTTFYICCISNPFFIHQSLQLVPTLLGRHNCRDNQQCRAEDLT